jgi:hypothetical protein
VPGDASGNRRRDVGDDRGRRRVARAANLLCSAWSKVRIGSLRRKPVSQKPFHEWTRKVTAIDEVRQLTQTEL